jgi:serine/threonine-protein kinase
MSPEREPLGRGFPKVSDPFGLTANRAIYIPREATERALRELVDCVRGGESVTALTGPPGLGKSLLLHLLADRLEAELHPVFLPYGALNPQDLAAYALDRLGSPRTDEPMGVLKAYARHLGEEASALLLLVDDAGAVPNDTARWLCELARGSDGSVRCVFAVTDDVASGDVVSALLLVGRGGAVPVVRLAAAMTRDETADYIEAHLAAGRVSGAVRALFGSAAITRLHEMSGGTPRRLHTAAQALLRQEGPAARGAQALLDEVASALDTAPPEAASGANSAVSPATQSEIEILRREVAALPAAAERPPSSRRSVAMAGVFVVAVVAGMLIAYSFRPLSAWLERTPAEHPPSEAVVRPLEEPALERAEPGDPISVNINATPWASVEVDGELLGETPLAAVLLEPGTHTFRARLPDGRIHERVVEIDADNRFVVFDDAPAAIPGPP